MSTYYDLNSTNMSDSHLHHQDQAETEAVPFLDHRDLTKPESGRRNMCKSVGYRIASSPMWFLATLSLLILLLIQNIIIATSPSHGHGFKTDLGRLSILHSSEYRTDPAPAYLKPHLKTYHTRFESAIRNTANGSMHVPDPALDSMGRPYTGPPSDTINAAWDDLITGRYVHLSPSEVLALNADTGVPPLTAINPSSMADEPGFYGGPDMLHSLHCLDALRKHLDAEYYEAKGMMPIPADLRKMHVNHCLEQLRQGVLCHADLTPVTLKPVRDESGKVWALLGETEREHTCRNGMEIAKVWRERGMREGSL